MKAIGTMPNGYKAIFSVNLQKDKKIAFLINTISLVIMLVMAVPMHFYIPIYTIYDMQNGL